MYVHAFAKVSGQTGDGFIHPLLKVVEFHHDAAIIPLALAASPNQTQPSFRIDSSVQLPHAAPQPPQPIEMRVNFHASLTPCSTACRSVSACPLRQASGVTRLAQFHARGCQTFSPQPLLIGRESLIEIGQPGHGRRAQPHARTKTLRHQTDESPTITPGRAPHTSPFSSACGGEPAHDGVSRPHIAFITASARPTPSARQEFADTFTHHSVIISQNDTNGTGRHVLLDQAEQIQLRDQQGFRVGYKIVYQQTADHGTDKTCP